MVIYAWDLSTEEVEAVDLGTWGYLQLHIKFETSLYKTLSQKNKKKCGGSKYHGLPSMFQQISNLKSG